MRNRIDIVAPTMLRAVQFAGGWMFDRVMAGWDVVVHVTDHDDARPVEILGARAIDLEQALTPLTRRTRPQALAVDATLCGADIRVQHLLLDAVSDVRTEVWLWGEGPTDLPGNTSTVAHRLSVAARAFKAQALAAVAADAVHAMDPVEVFRSSDPVTFDLPTPPRARKDSLPAFSG